MSIRWLILSEILFRKGSFFLACSAIALVVCILTSSVVVSRSNTFVQMKTLREKELQSRAVMKSFEDSCEQIAGRMGYTYRIIPPGQTEQDFFADGYARGTMAQEAIGRVASLHSNMIAGIAPVLRQKVWWPEQKRSILLCGVGPLTKNTSRSAERVLSTPPAFGTVVIGYELGRELQIKPEQQLAILGHPFAVDSSAEQRGSIDDITVWATLDEAQKILRADHKISEIWVWAASLQGDGAKLSASLGQTIPGSSVIELTQRALLGARSRIAALKASAAAIERERIHSTEISARRASLNGLITMVGGIGCLLWIIGISFDNLHSRRHEIGLLRAFGVSKFAVFTMFIARVVAVGFIGALVGCLLGFLGAGALVMHGGPRQFSFVHLAIILVIAPLSAAVAGLVPALRAARQDPAEVLVTE